MPKRMLTHEVFEALEGTSKILEKLDILEKNKNNVELKEVFEAALNPYKQYGIKKIPEYTTRPHGTGSTLRSIVKKLDILTERRKTGNAAIEWLSKQLASLPPQEAIILERIIQKDMRCGVQTKTVNKIWAGLIPEYPCMLCETYDERNMLNINYPAIVQEKLDGMRVNIIVKNGKVEFRSRNGKELDLLGNLEKEFLTIANGQNIVFDGEMLVTYKGGVGYMKRKKGNGILNKAIKGTISQEEAEKAVVVLFDSIPYNEFTNGKWEYPYFKRWEWLQKQVNRKAFDKVRLVESDEVDSFFFIKRMFERITAKEGEGVVIKNRNTIWENKRSKSQIKMKVENEADLVIKEIAEGSGKYQGLLGAFVCQTSDGLLEVSVGSGFKDEDREKYFTDDMVGKVIAVKYNEVIDTDAGDKSLFLPIFIEVRDDKSEANSLTELS